MKSTTNRDRGGRKSKLTKTKAAQNFALNIRCCVVILEHLTEKIDGIDAMTQGQGKGKDGKDKGKDGRGK